MSALPVKKEHLRGIAALEAECFHQPWSEQALELLLGEDAIGAVCVEGDEVIAYGGMLLTLDEGQITNVAVRGTHRRQGYGKEILGALLLAAREKGAKEIFLEVRASNTGAQGLYLQYGFEQVGTRRGFYQHPREDAIVMRRILD